MKPWLTDLRKVAGVTFVVTLVSLLLPMWDTTRNMIFLESTYQMSKRWMISTIVVTYIFTAILPAFYFALSRNDGALRFPKRLRLLALLAALIFSLIVVADLPDRISSLGSYLAAPAFDWRIGASNVLTFARDPRTLGQFSTLLGELANIAYIVMLIAVFRWPGEPGANDVPISRSLRVTTKVAVVALGLWLVILFVGLALAPYEFLKTRDYALQMGRKTPILGNMLASQARMILVQACLFAAPYIVYRSQRERTESPIEAQLGPELVRP